MKDLLDAQNNKHMYLDKQTQTIRIAARLHPSARHFRMRVVLGINHHPKLQGSVHTLMLVVLACTRKITDGAVAASTLPWAAATRPTFTSCAAACCEITFAKTQHHGKARSTKNGASLATTGI